MPTVYSNFSWVENSAGITSIKTQDRGEIYLHNACRFIGHHCDPASSEVEPHWEVWDYDLNSVSYSLWLKFCGVNWVEVMDGDSGYPVDDQECLNQVLLEDDGVVALEFMDKKTFRVLATSASIFYKE